jgi:hypothetical protein
MLGHPPHRFGGQTTVKIEFLESGSPGCPLIRLYGDEPVMYQQIRTGAKDGSFLVLDNGVHPRILTPVTHLIREDCDADATCAGPAGRC